MHLDSKDEELRDTGHNINLIVGVSNGCGFIFGSL